MWFWSLGRREHKTGSALKPSMVPRGVDLYQQGVPEPTQLSGKLYVAARGTLKHFYGAQPLVGGQSSETRAFVPKPWGLV